MSGESGRQANASYVSLVSALFRTMPATLIMTALFCGTGLLAYSHYGDGPLLWLLIAGSIISVLRIAILAHGKSINWTGLETGEVFAAERRFALAYLPFAIVVGLFSARLFAIAHEDFRILAAVLVAGYAAGVAAGVYTRPWICVPAIVLGVAPLVLYCGVSPGDLDRLLALMLAAFSAGGIQASVSRYKLEAASLQQRDKLASFSRQDELTALPNQLALLEEADANIAQRRHCWMHLVEIDGLAELNRSGGYARGDAVIRAVANRLSFTVGDHGFLARLSGGQFAILQIETLHFSDVPLLLEQLVEQLRMPIDIEGEPTTIAAHIASAQMESGWKASQLLAAARLADRHPVDKGVSAKPS